MTDTTAQKLSSSIIGKLTARGLTIAVAESLTGGLLVAELIRTPGASVVVSGGVVAYNTELKHTLLGVDGALLAEHGAVHPDVAEQMAGGVRLRLAVGGVPAAIGIATTGVAGPTEQDGQPVGTVYIGLAVGEDVRSIRLQLTGSRDDIRSSTVVEALAWLDGVLE